MPGNGSRKGSRKGSIKGSIKGSKKGSKKLLPKPNRSIHLSKYGYTTSKKESTRKLSLNKASAKMGSLPVLKRLNLIRNLTRPELEVKKVLSKDVEYMKEIYKKEKVRQTRAKAGSKKAHIHK
jgi:hypothetical protein